MAHHPAKSHLKVEDLAVLSKLDEGILNTVLEQRFRLGEIYTYIGDILIAINPYRHLPIYDQLHSEIYKNVQTRKTHKPHIYMIADAAYHQMLSNTHPQCCIVSGESGAGKTESIKLILQQLVAICSSKVHQSVATNMQKKLIELNPLLEAFGNAETVMNDNSSRFSKYIEVLFNHNGALLGGQMSIFLVEKTRVTSSGIDEFNFHIFYHMFAGLSDEDRNRFLLKRPEQHRILRRTDGSGVFKNKAEYTRHQQRFRELLGLMSDLGFTEFEKDCLIANLSAIINLTDIEFLPDEQTQGVYISEEIVMEDVCRLLSIPAEPFAEALVGNINYVRAEKIVTLKKLEQANDGRDALARTFYSKLFSWIVGKVNQTIKPENQSEINNRLIIGLLDIAGFENFRINRFEQLCINVANEQLQFYFNQHVFAWEIKDLEAEGITNTKSLTFTNNAPTLNLFFEKPLGFYALLDEESRFPKATTQTFLEKSKKYLGGSSKIYKKEKGRDPLFNIHHYAGWVRYNATNILEKNRDTVSVNLIDVIKTSESPLVRQLFNSQASQQGDIPAQQTSPYRHVTKPSTLDKTKSLSKSAGKKIKANMRNGHKHYNEDLQLKLTASSQFQSSLSELVSKLQQGQPHFVRCIKPNTSRVGDAFDQTLVFQQLKYTGILETVRIRHQGFPVRPEFVEFINKYKFICYPVTARLTPDPSHCVTILRAGQIKDWQIGRRKVFLRYYHTEQLDNVLHVQYKRLIKVQSFVRRYLAKKYFEQFKQYEANRKAAQVQAFMMSIGNICGQFERSLRDLNSIDQQIQQAKDRAARELLEKARREQEAAERRQQEEAERRQREEVARRQREEAGRRQREEAGRRQREETARRLQEQRRKDDEKASERLRAQNRLKEQIERKHKSAPVISLDSDQQQAIDVLDSVLADHVEEKGLSLLNNNNNESDDKVIEQRGKTLRGLQGRGHVAGLRSRISQLTQAEQNAQKSSPPAVKDKKWILNGDEYVPNPKTPSSPSQGFYKKRPVSQPPYVTSAQTTGQPVNILSGRDAQYERGNMSHYARQNSGTSIHQLKSKQSHYKQ